MLVIQSIIALLYLSILSSTSFAAPVPNLDAVTTNSICLVARHPRRPLPVPAVDEIKKQLIIAKDTSLFYSGSTDVPPVGTEADAQAWAKVHNKRYKVMAELWKDKKYPDHWQTDPHTIKAFWDNASQAMAEMTSGTAYVMMPTSHQPDGKDWRPDSFWARKEWPVLQTRPEVTKVIRIDPEGVQKVLKG